MHSMHSKYLLTLLFCLIFSAGSAFSVAYAQIASMTPEQMISNLRSGTGGIGINDVVGVVRESSNLTTTQATSFVESIVSNSNITDALGGDLLGDVEQLQTRIGDITSIIDQVGEIQASLDSITGLMNSVQNMDLSDLGSVQDMLDNIQDLNIDADAASKLLEQVGNLELPPEIGEALSTIGDLGELLDAESLSDVLQNPVIQDALSSLTGDQAQEAIEQLAQIADIAMDPSVLADMATDAIVDEILSALEQANPALAAQLESLLGGGAALEAALGAALGSLSAGGGSGGGGSCGAECGSCNQCAPEININHQWIRAHVTAQFEQHRNWITTTYFIEKVGPALMLMTEQLVSTGMQQIQIIGGFFDAKHQLETQRMMQVMTAEAHKDYQPSESVCKIGSNVRSLAMSERKSNLTQEALASRMMQRQLMSAQNVSGEKGVTSDRDSRMKLVIDKFCNKLDGGTDREGDAGMSKLCKDTPSQEQINKDINYTETVERKLTLDLDPIERNGGAASKDEENVFALGANLFAQNLLPMFEKKILANADHEPYNFATFYLDARAIAAKRSVAQNSFAAITAMRASGDGNVDPFLKAILKESGLNPTEIEARLGENPSYFAQMEVLTKDMLQNPEFYANLQDKPANVERKSAALLALEIMQDRDIYESLLRSEAVLATLLETTMQKDHLRISSDILQVQQKSNKRSNLGGGS